jgi:hypothetical protein
MPRVDSPLSKALGVVFAGVAAVVWFLDTYTAVPVKAGFDGASPVTFALGVAALVAVGVVLFVTETAFEN